MTRYLALLRGVNVGGKNKLPMAALAASLRAAGLADVRTFIQSGNVLFSSPESAPVLADQIQALIREAFGIEAGAAVYGRDRWLSALAAAPTWWGADPDWKHNLLVLLDSTRLAETMAAFDRIKPEIEQVAAGDGLIFQSLSVKQFGKTTTSRLPALPAYRNLTIRNYNTATALARLLDEA